MSALDSTNSIKQVPFWIVGQIYFWNCSIHLNALTAELNLPPKVLFGEQYSSFVMITKYRGIFLFFIIVFKNTEKFIVT